MADSTNTPTTAPLLLDRHGAARLLGVSPGTIDNLRLRGQLPSLKIGARRLYVVAELVRFIESRTCCATPATIDAGEPRAGGGAEGVGR